MIWRAGMSTREQRIRVIAYHLWEQGGRPDGHSEQLWLAAEAQYEADLAKERYEEEIATGLPEAAATKPTPSEKAKPAGPAVPKPARPTRAKSGLAPETAPVEVAPEKKMRSAKAKAAEQPKEKPLGSVKRKPKAP